VTSIRTTCPYCGVGCGVLATADGKGGMTVRGDPDHPANRGKLCVKGTALGETVGLDHRLLAPRIGGIEADWDRALDLIADRFRQTIAEHGPESVALYVSGQLLTEDYYVANKLMKGYIGTANIDTNSRLCMASSVAGHRRAFGTDTVPGTYEDLDQADLIVLVGSNLAWCHPVLHQRVLASGAQVVVVDPRRTATCDGAWHLPIAPGSDAALFNALLAGIADRGLIDPTFPANGAAEALAAARDADPALTGLPNSDLQRFIDMWCDTPRVVTLWSQGINQSDTGTDKVNAIINCHLATGRIGRPGMGPFSVTGQPNAMGGREVGGLANMLAAHLDIDEATHRTAVQNFWQSPTIAQKQGLKATDIFRAVGDGRIKALWILHTNPAVTMPLADDVANAIAACPFTVVSDIRADTDTARLARVLLPAAAWGEKDGTVTNSDRTISRQRAVLPPPGEARADWWALAQVAQRMGFTGFAWEGPAAIFREHAALSGVAAALGKDFDISAHAQITSREYETLTPFRWPTGGPDRFFADGRFFTPDGRARMVAVTPKATTRQHEHSFILNTGRIRDQWHTMTRTGLAPRLNNHRGEPFLEVHPDDAARLGLTSAGIARVTNAHGSALLRTLITDRVAPGHPFAPMHWTAGNASAARIDSLIPARVDPISGQPALKSAAVAIAPFAARWFGYAVATSAFRPATAYWATAPIIQGWQAELAHDTNIDPETLARTLFNLPDARLSIVTDPARGTARLAFAAPDGTLSAALFMSPDPVALSRTHVAGLLGTAPAAVALAGHPGKDQPDPGPQVCACMNIGANTILAAACDGHLTLSAIGEATRAGVTCGSCRPEIAALLSRFTMKEAAE
jgi:assimilatory nitrate reductase catalytic subunit